tara:strand:- start:522 stop:737 length:216 start_codon:yes stop_codon:yes gene_type:complete
MVKYINREVKMKKQKMFICEAFGNRGLVHAWGRGKNELTARLQCELAVKESLIEKPSKIRHFPMTYKTRQE